MKSNYLHPHTLSVAADSHASLLTAGTMAPDFSLPKSPGEHVALADLRGRPAVLIFYPADWSPVCGSEVTLYSSLAEEFAAFDAQVFGVSVDGPWCHQAYARAQNANFPLLADFEPKGELARGFGVYREREGTSERALFVLDAAGQVRWSHLSDIKINPGASGLLAALAALRDGGDPPEGNPSTLLVPPGPADHAQGAPDAAVTLVEYGDYECPFCARAYPVIRALQNRFGPEQLCHVYRHFPLASAHPSAWTLALAAEAAAHAGKFWEMHDALCEAHEAFFGRGTSDDRALDVTLRACAARAGLEPAAVSGWLAANQEQVAARIRSEVAAGARSGVNGTPCFFVDGERFDGEPEELVGLIEQRLAASVLTP